MQLYIDGNFVKEVDSLSHAINFLREQGCSPFGLVLKQGKKIVYRERKIRGV